MLIYYLIIALLMGIIIFLTVKLLTIKKQMKIIAEELSNTKDMDYNKLVSIALADKDLIEMSKQMNDNLEFQKQMKWKAQKSENELKQSISDIAHDLRTPITVVKGNLQMLEKESDLTDKCKEYVSICSEKTDVLKKMVDDFFELSYLESEATVVDLEKTDLTELIAGFIICHETVIRQNDIEPVIQLPEKSIFVNADKELLTRMLENILNNILKHASDSFVLSLSQDDKVRISFSNPVPKDASFDTDRLFDRTYRGNKARTGGGPGGIGLYIVKLLAQKQGIEAIAKHENNMLSIILVFNSIE